jgi:hypothetical protein
MSRERKVHLVTTMKMTGRCFLMTKIEQGRFKWLRFSKEKDRELEKIGWRTKRWR